MISAIKDKYNDFWSKRSRTYLHQPLEDDSQGGEDEAFLREKELLRAHSRSKGLGGHCMILLLIVILAVWTLLMSLVFRYQHARSVPRNEPPEHLQIFSPLEEAIEWEHYTYNAGLFGQKSKYMGQPTKETDDLWLDIVEHGMVTIPEAMAKRITNRSTEWSEKPGYHVFGTEMFHQMHCLNTMRLALWAEVPEVMYGHEGEGPFEHLGNCIDYLRQTILCHGDVHLIPLGYEGGHGHPVFDTVHVCRKYEPIVEWVDEHQAGDITPNGVGPPSGLHIHKDHDHHLPKRH